MKTTCIHNITRNVFLSLALILCFATLAQTEKPSSKKSQKLYGGVGHLNFSAEQLNISALNIALSANGYGKISPFNLSFGGGGVYVIHNFIVGGGGSWLSSSKTQNSGNALAFKGGHGYASFGYVLFSGKRSLLYPTLGIGGGGYNLLISKKDVQSDFSQQLNSPNTGINASAGGWMLNLQLTYHYFFSKPSAEGFFIGVKGGYRYSPNSWKMTIDNKELNGSPNINMNGFYLSLILGGGSVFKN